jgi:hypothetical protein
VSEDARLRLVRELERADEEVAAVLTEVDELYDGVEGVRTRTLALTELCERLPAEREAAERFRADAEAERRRTEAAAERAEADLVEAEAQGEPERLAAARRFEIRARDAAGIAARRAAEAAAAASELADREAAAEREVGLLEGRAAELAAALRARPRLAEAGAAPDRGLDGLARWASGARAALLVARSALAAERDAVIRQANELGALVLGEPLTSSAAAVARRVERELGSDQLS